MGGSIGTGDYIEGKLGRFGYVSKVDEKDYTEYIFLKEDFYDSQFQFRKDIKNTIICGGTTTPIIIHLNDCTMISRRNLPPESSSIKPRSSLRIINPDKSKRDVAVSKLVEILK